MFKKFLVSHLGKYNLNFDIEVSIVSRTFWNDMG